MLKTELAPSPWSKLTKCNFNRKKKKLNQLKPESKNEHTCCSRLKSCNQKQRTEKHWSHSCKRSLNSHIFLTAFKYLQWAWEKEHVCANIGQDMCVNIGRRAYCLWYFHTVFGHSFFLSVPTCCLCLFLSFPLFHKGFPFPCTSIIYFEAICNCVCGGCVTREWFYRLW